jgi:hypothetical protein
MHRRFRLSGRRLAVSLAVALAAAPAAASGADPGRWRETGIARIPFEYFQGVASAPDRRLWFDGVFAGLYRTDDRLSERARSDAAIPPLVTAREGYNHIGDITWDAAEGGRILLPLECYYPGRAGGANSCGTGSIGVADPDTLRWRYYVKLDPAEISKAMWAEVSPDGRLVWTSSGADLLAYRTAHISRALAAPGATPIRAVRRVAAAVPTAGITGAAFYGDRLMLAGQDDTLFQVWSVDLATGGRRLEIERRIVGESEGLDVIDALGGVLHWIVTPIDPAGRPPTYGTGSNVLLHFVPATHRRILRLAVRPRELVAGRPARVTFIATTLRNGRRRPVAGAQVRLAGARARTSARGTARPTVRITRPGRYRATASRADLRTGAVTLRVVAAKQEACVMSHATARVTRC